MISFMLWLLCPGNLFPPSLACLPAGKPLGSLSPSPLPTPQGPSSPTSLLDPALPDLTVQEQTGGGLVGGVKKAKGLRSTDW